MKKQKDKTERKLLEEMLEICLDILEELANAKTRYGLLKKERYERRVEQIRKKIKSLSNA